MFVRSTGLQNSEEVMLFPGVEEENTRKKPQNLVQFHNKVVRSQIEGQV